MGDEVVVAAAVCLQPVLLSQHFSLLLGHKRGVFWWWGCWGLCWTPPEFWVGAAPWERGGEGGRFGQGGLSPPQDPFPIPEAPTPLPGSDSTRAVIGKSGIGISAGTNESN